MSKGKRTAKRAASVAKRRKAAVISRAIAGGQQATKKSWLTGWGYIIVSAIMVVILAASVLTFLGSDAIGGGPAPTPTSETDGVPAGAILNGSAPTYVSVYFAGGRAYL